MSRFQFELSTDADDAGLREVLRRTPMGGQVSVTFRREPSYFRGAPADGPFRQVIVCRDGETGRIVGFGLRAVRPMYVNGEARDIGYLGSLRLLPEYRNRGLVARGFRFFRELHQDGRTPLYLTTIAEGNTKAIEMLTSGRAGLPTYHPYGTYHTAAFSLPFRVYQVLPWGVNIDEAKTEQWEEVLAFLHREGRRRQFFPSYQPADFFTPGGTFLDLDAGNILVARRAGRIVGVLAVWDQHGFKQTIVDRYTGVMRFLRLLLRLPRPGKELRQVKAAFPIVEKDDPVVFAALLQAGRARQPAGSNQYLVIGLHARDPLLRAVHPGWGRWYRTRLFLVHWPDGKAARESLEDRVPYLELGCL